MLNKKREKIIEEIRSSLCEYILEYIIYIDSGHDAYKAFLILSQRNDGKLLTNEFFTAGEKILNGCSFQKTIMSLSDKYYQNYLDSFLRIVIRSYLRGSEGAQENLRILIERMLHEEISAIKEKAEKINTKLSFPITIIFIAIILISVYPALTQFKV